MSNFSRALAAVERVMMVTSWPCIVVIMLVTAIDVIIRKLSLGALPATIELVSLLMIAVTYLAMPQLQAAGGHVAADLVYERLPASVQRWLTVVTSLLVLFFFVLLTWYATGRAWQSWEVREYAFGLVPFPLYLSKSLVPLGGFVVCLRLVVQILETAAGNTGHAPEVEVHGS